MREPKPSFVAEYYLVRTYGQRHSFVMVEGETDEEVWGCFAATECRLFPSRGKDNIIEALTISELREVPGIAGIIDLDYSLIAGSYPRNIPDLLYDDCCPDIESIILSSSALKNVLRKNLCNYEIEQVHKFAEDLTTEAHGLAMQFGYFRLLNHLNDCGLRCNAIRFEDVIDGDSLKLDNELIASKLTGAVPGLTSEDLLQQIDELREQYPPDNPQLCRGKDVLAILAFLLPIRFKAEFGEDLPGDTRAALKNKALSIRLRSAYDSEYFKQTSLFNCIRQWECNNKPHRIIRDFSA